MPTCIKVIILSDTATTNKNETTRTVEYFVQYADGTATSIEACHASDGTTSIPMVSSWADGLYVQDISAERIDDDKTCFNVTVKWTNKVDQEQDDPEDGGDDPWNIEFSSDGVVYQEEIYKDAAGNKIVNTAGEPVNPPLVKEYFDEEFVISYNVDNVNFTNVNNARGTINLNAVTLTLAGRDRVFAADTLRLVRASIRWEGIKRWRVSLAFQYRKDTWITKVQSKGFHHKDGDGNLVRNKDGDEVLNEPQFLNADGTDWIRSGDTLPAPLEYRIPDRLDFATVLAGLFNIYTS